MITTEPGHQSGPPRSRALLALVLGGGLAAALWSCTDAGLQPVQPPGNAALDDKLRIDAHICTSPSVDDFFPVKILFLVDTSDSMSVTDRGGVRAQAIADVLNRYGGNPSVKFAAVAFDSKIDVLTPGFTNSPDVGKVSQRLSMADRLTDYQGALGTAYSLISEDIIASPRAERPRTKYVIVFFSDGTPDPQCSAKGPNPFLVCDVPKDQWADAFDPPLDKSLYPDLQAGGDYNQPAQIDQKVDQILALQDFYHVGEIRLHTAFLFDPKAATDPLAAPFHLDRAAGAALLTAMAIHGRGTYTEFDSSTKINFLSVGYAALRASYEMASFIANNTNAPPRPPASGASAAAASDLDTDGDGLDDATEFSLKTCVGAGGGGKCKDPTDSDGDGYGDFVEAMNLRAGFDPTNPAKPAQKCASTADSDGDGLLDCEEAVYGTDPRLFDSDGDRLGDLMEVRAGLNPTDASDALADPDRDGVRSLDEIRRHTDPLVSDQTRPSDTRYSYDVEQSSASFGDRTCYDLTVRDVRLVTTGSGTESMTGKNRVLVYFDEALKDRPQDYGRLRVACVDVRYVDGAFKSPPSGRVTLDEKRFVDAARFKPATDCLDLTAVTSAPDGGAGDGGAGDGAAGDMK